MGNSHHFLWATTKSAERVVSCCVKTLNGLKGFDPNPTCLIILSCRFSPFIFHVGFRVKVYVLSCRVDNGWRSGF